MQGKLSRLNSPGSLRLDPKDHVGETFLEELLSRAFSMGDSGPLVSGGLRGEEVHAFRSRSVQTHGVYLPGDLHQARKGSPTPRERTGRRHALILLSSTPPERKRGM